MQQKETVSASVYTLDEMLMASGNFMKVASGQETQVARDPGLILTTEDVRQIRAYVSSGLALPTNPQQVRKLLGNYSSGISGLAPEDIRDLYAMIQAHCQTWAPLESDIRKVGSDLYVFSDSLLETARTIVEFVTGLESYQSLRVADLTPEQIDALPPVALAPGDRQKIPVLMSFFEELKTLLQEHSASTTRVKAGVGEFKKTLSSSIAPDVSLKVQLSNSADTSREVARLNGELAILTQRIDQKTAEYGEYVKYALIGVWWGPIGAAITGSIYGIKAENVRKEKNELIESKRRIEEQLMKLNHLLGLLRTLETNLQDLEGRIDGATVGISGLESIWVLLEELVKSSENRVARLKSATYLAVVVLQFNVVISNWTNIKKQSLELLTAFDNAIGR
ncbi:alpha-xenorhabdolysin family binary toxin subunit A [Pseudomonas sp. NPDC087358]|uniref:alpha-xenorhabdolysin family binary toxin subunit A n=1 Tax=Pseudomonas sp. NPDC087358 TaxID=3364439 RepID=UPI00384ADB43